MIALTRTQLLPHWVTCSDCRGWFDPLTDLPTSGPAGHWVKDEGVICLNCAVLLGFTTCDDCATVIHEHDAVHYIDFVYCYDCALCNGITQCAECDKWIDDEDITDCYGDDLCTDCRDSRGFNQCECCDEWHNDTIYVDAGGSYCSECFSSNFASCSGCEEIYILDDLTEDGYCTNCMDENCTNSWEGCPEYDLVGSSRRYGIELETDTCDGWRGYEHPAWSAKADVSVRGMEFVTSILYGNDGLKAIRHICEYAKVQRWDVDGRCGYHLHIDISKEPADSLKAIAFAYHATYDVWKHFVSGSRWPNMYCKPMEHTLQCYLALDSIVDWRGFSRQITKKYQWVNWGAYQEHTSLEIRIHEGTLDYNKICNWMRAHTTFVDWAASAGIDEVRAKLWGRPPQEQFEFIRGIWSNSGCYDLTDFYACDELMEVTYA